MCYILLIARESEQERLTEALVIRIAPSMKKQLEKAAKRNHRKLPAEIRLACERHLEKAA